MKKRILFVDDEPNILRSIQRMLRDMRNDWDMEFVESAALALDKLKEEPWDVIVTDILMPNMNGLELLDRVMKEFPSVVRIILSGHFDQDTAMGSVRLAHQSVHKPCQPEELKVTIQRAFLLQEELAGDELKNVVGNMDKLPSLPILYDRIVQALNAPDASMKKIGEIISMDIGMTAKVLQLVNSAYFGLRRHINTPTEAVIYLGMEQIKALVLSVYIFAHAQELGMNEQFLKDLWEHSFLTGLYARAIAQSRTEDKSIVDAAFTAGVLHDVGKLIFLANYTSVYDGIIKTVKEEHKFFSEAEREKFKVTHPEIGAYLLSIWGLPDKIVEAVMYHHSPNLCVDGGEFGALTAVHIANYFSSRKVFAGQGIRTVLDMRYMEKVKIVSFLKDFELLCMRITQPK